MAATLTFWDSAGSAQITSLSFSGVVPGTVSAAQQFRVVGSGGDSESPAIILRQEDGSGEAVTSGLRAVDERHIEVRALGTGTSAQEETGWMPIGKFRWFALTRIANGEFTLLEARYAPPNTVQQGSVDFLLDADPGTNALPLGQGHSESGRDGVVSGLLDGSWSELLAGADVTQASVPGASVDLPDVVYRHVGIPVVELTQNFGIDENDGSAAALGAGEAYWARLSLGASGWVVTKGDKAASPLDVATLPENPAGNLPIAYVERQQGNILDGWITHEDVVGGFAPDFTGASLLLAVGPGRALVGNSLVRLTAASAVPLSASSTSQVWLQSDGTFAATDDGSRPSVDALLLFDGVVTDGVGITALVDRRWSVGAEPVLVSFSFSGVLSDGAESFAVNPYPRDLYLRPVRGCHWSIFDNQPGAGNTTGVTKVDVEYSDAGGAWTTLFTSQGSDDRRPSVEHDDTDPTDVAGLPEVLVIPAGARLRATVARTEAYSSTAPDDATLVLHCDLP